MNLKFVTTCDLHITKMDMRHENDFNGGIREDMIHFHNQQLFETIYLYFMGGKCCFLQKCTSLIIFITPNYENVFKMDEKRWQKKRETTPKKHPHSRESTQNWSRKSDFIKKKKKLIDPFTTLTNQDWLCWSCFAVSPHALSAHLFNIVASAESLTDFLLQLLCWAEIKICVSYLCISGLQTDVEVLKATVERHKEVLVEKEREMVRKVQSAREEEFNKTAALHEEKWEPLISVFWGWSCK